MVVAKDSVALFNQISTEVRAMTTEMGTLRAEISSLRNTLDPIHRIIRGDVDTPSILTTVAVLQNDLSHFRSLLDDDKLAIKSLADHVAERDKVDRTSRIMLLAAIITGVLGLVSAIASAAIALYKPH